MRNFLPPNVAFRETTYADGMCQEGGWGPLASYHAGRNVSVRAGQHAY